MKARHVIVACAFLLAPVSVYAGIIVGIGNAGPALTGTTFFTVDPLTGNTTSFGQFFSSGYYAAGLSPVTGTFLAMSPVNLYSLNPFTGERIGYLCYDASDCTYAGIEPAYDPTNQTIFSLAGPSDAPILTRVMDRGLLPDGLGPPGSHRVTYVPIGDLGITGITVIEYVPGLGLYGTDRGGAGYLIDETTGHATLLAPLTGIALPITGLAYDFDTGQLLGSAGVLLGTGPGMIYELDPQSGHATILNPQAPDLVGIAFVTIPEAQPVWMLIGGLLVGLRFRKQLRCSPRSPTPIFDGGRHRRF